MDSLRGEFDAAWAQFQSLEELRLASDTLESEWTRGRDTYLALLVALDDPEAVAYLRRVVHGIDHIPGVEPYPEGYWHITVKGLGFGAEPATRPDDVSDRDVERIAQAARRVFEAQPAFEVRIGPANGFPEVVFAEVWDSLPVRELNVRLLEAVPGLVRYPFDGEVWLPHVSIARFTSREGLAQLKEAIAGLREEPPGPAFAVREVHLIRAYLSQRAPSLETIETYRLPG